MHHAVELLKILRRSEDLKGVKYVLELLVPVLEPELWPMKQWEPKGRERDRLNALLKGWNEIWLSSHKI